MEASFRRRIVGSVPATICDYHLRNVWCSSLVLSVDIAIQISKSADNQQLALSFEMSVAVDRSMSTASVLGLIFA